MSKTKGGGLGMPDQPMKCSRCGLETAEQLKDVSLKNGWVYGHWFSDAKRWQAVFLCPDCASQFELWMEET